MSKAILPGEIQQFFGFNEVSLCCRAAWTVLWCEREEKIAYAVTHGLRRRGSALLGVLEALG